VAATTRASIVVVAHNSAADLPACLASLIPSLGRNDEALVFDSASIDGSSEVAARFPVKVVYSEQNVGYGGGGNRAAEHAVGRYLVFLNPDTIVEPGWLDALLEPLAGGPGLATAKVLLMDDPTRIDTCANAVHLSGITVCRSHRRPAECHPGLERVMAVSGAAFAIDHDLFRRLGGFDERFFMYLEDTDLSLRAALTGAPCWYVGTSRIRHRHAPAFGPHKFHWLERNRWLMLLKVWSLPTLIRMVPVLGLVEMLTWGYALLGGPTALRAKFSAWLWLLSRPAALASARRATQRLRVVDDRELLNRCAWRLDTTELIGNRLLGRSVEFALTPLFAFCRLFLSVPANEPHPRAIPA
jgi:GT2 family glycosyltransferase